VKPKKISKEGEN